MISLVANNKDEIAALCKRLGIRRVDVFGSPVTGQFDSATSDIEGQTNQTFLQDRGLQLIVHKLLEIVGEALNGAKNSEPTIAHDVDDLRRYIALRHQITHGYDTIDYNILWNISKTEIQHLIDELSALLGDAPETASSE